MPIRYWSWPALLGVAYLLIHLAFLLTARRPTPNRIRLMAFDLGLAALLSLLVWLSRGPASGWILFVRLWGPVVFFWWAYAWAGRVLCVYYPPRFSLDRIIIGWEDRIGQPSLHWALKERRWVVEAFHAFYAGYYLYTPIVGIALHLTHRHRDFEAMSFAVVFGYCLGYSCFSLIPVWGPRWGLVTIGRLDPSRQRLKGYAVTALMNRVMYQGPAHKGGAMPSTHSSTAVVFAVWCWRIWGLEGGLVAAVAVLGMWLGSIHGRYHYVVDVLAGGLLGLLSIVLADALYS